MILVTGASGTVGREVLFGLMKTGKPVTAMYRSAEDARNAPAGVSTVTGDFADRGSLEKVLEGVNTVFLVCSPIPQLVELESAVIEACQQAGVRHIVLNSALGAADYPKSFPAWHRRVEEKLKGSGLGKTIIRPNTFMQNIVAFNAGSIRAQGAFYSAMNDAKLSFIDVRDIGAATARILADPVAHAGKVYELNGPEALSYSEVAAMISKIAGREVKFVNIPEETQRNAMLDAGMPGWQIEALLDLQKYYTVEKKGAEITPVLAELLGRAPTQMEQYLNENRHAFRAQGASA